MVVNLLRVLKPILWATFSMFNLWKIGVLFLRRERVEAIPNNATIRSYKNEKLLISSGMRPYENL